MPALSSMAYHAGVENSGWASFPPIRIRPKRCMANPAAASTKMFTARIRNHPDIRVMNSRATSKIRAACSLNISASRMKTASTAMEGNVTCGCRSKPYPAQLSSPGSRFSESSKSEAVGRICNPLNGARFRMALRRASFSACFNFIASRRFDARCRSCPVSLMFLLQPVRMSGCSADLILPRTPPPVNRFSLEGTNGLRAVPPADRGSKGRFPILIDRTVCRSYSENSGGTASDMPHQPPE